MKLETVMLLVTKPIIVDGKMSVARLIKEESDKNKRNNSKSQSCSNVSASYFCSRKCYWGLWTENDKIIVVIHKASFDLRSLVACWSLFTSSVWSSWRPTQSQCRSRLLLPSRAALGWLTSCDTQSSSRVSCLPVTFYLRVMWLPNLFRSWTFR